MDEWTSNVQEWFRSWSLQRRRNFHIPWLYHMMTSNDSVAGTISLLANKPAFHMHRYRFFLYQAVVKLPLNTGKETTKSRRPTPKRMDGGEDPPYYRHQKGTADLIRCEERKRHEKQETSMPRVVWDFRWVDITHGWQHLNLTGWTTGRCPDSWTLSAMSKTFVELHMESIFGATLLAACGECGNPLQTTFRSPSLWLRESVQYLIIQILWIYLTTSINSILSTLYVMTLDWDDNFRIRIRQSLFKIPLLLFPQVHGEYPCGISREWQADTYPLDGGSYGVVPAKSRQSHPCLTHWRYRVRVLHFRILLLTINLRSNIVSKAVSIIISRMSVFGANEWWYRFYCHIQYVPFLVCQGSHQIVILMGMDSYPIDRPQMRSSDAYSIVSSWSLGIEKTSTSSPKMGSHIATLVFATNEKDLSTASGEELPPLNSPSTAPMTMVGSSRTEPKHMNKELDKLSVLWWIC